MFYIIYKTTNLLNGKYYIGKHKCSSLDDGYLGSGTILRKAIKKYGKENFKRETLFTFDNEDDMNNKERELITEEMINDKMVYNVHPGGKGGFTLEEAIRGSEAGRLAGSLEKATEGSLKYWSIPENKERQRQTMKQNGAKNGKKNKGKVRSEETKKKISDTLKNGAEYHGRRIPKRIVTIKLPDGSIETTTHLCEWCKERGLNASEKLLNKRGYYILNREKITKEMRKNLDK